MTVAQEKSKSALMTEEAYVAENGEKAQKYAQEVSAIAQRIYDEANSAYRQGEKNISPALFRKIEDYGNTKIIKEILNGENGTIIRISTFENGQLRDVEEGYKVSYDGTIYKGKEITYDENGALEWYNEGYKQTPDGHWNREKRANFKDGKLRLYEENLTGDKTNFLELGKRVCFVDGSLSDYMEDLKRNSNKELEKPRKELYLENGKIKLGYTSSEILPDNSIEFKNRIMQSLFLTTKYAVVRNTQDGTLLTSDVLSYANGNCVSYCKSTERFNNGRTILTDFIKLEDGQPKEYYGKAEQLPNGEKIITNGYRYTSNGWQKISN